MYHVYGIPNCDTVKKARRWLDTRGVSYTFHDYKKEGVPADLDDWVAQVGWESLLNRRGTTWRKLPSDVQARSIDSASARQLMREHASLIKRPVVTDGRAVIAVGFDEQAWAKSMP